MLVSVTVIVLPGSAVSGPASSAPKGLELSALGAARLPGSSGSSEEQAANAEQARVRAPAVLTRRVLRRVPGRAAGVRRSMMRRRYPGSSEASWEALIPDVQLSLIHISEPT